MVWSLIAKVVQMLLDVLSLYWVASLDEVFAHDRRAPQAPAGHRELEPLNLSEVEIRQLIAFLKSLSGPIAADS